MTCLDTSRFFKTIDAVIVQFIKMKALVVVSEDCDKVSDAQDSSFECVFDGLLLLHLFWISVNHCSAFLGNYLAGATFVVELVLSSLSTLKNSVTSILLLSLPAIEILLIISSLGLIS